MAYQLHLWLITTTKARSVNGDVLQVRLGSMNFNSQKEEVMRAALLVSILFLFGSLHSSALGVTINETLDGTTPAANPAYRPETGGQTGRLTRNLPPSTCATPAPNPGNFTTSGTRQYDEYGFVALSTGCVTVTLSNAGNGIFYSVAYDQNGINPADPSQNFVADAGNSPTTLVPVRSFSMNVVAGQAFHVVVHEVNAGGGIGQSYTLDVSGVKLDPDFSAAETLDIISPAVSSSTLLSATGNQTGRLNRFNPPSTCTAPKPNPGLNTPTGARRTDLYRFVPFASGCVTATINHTGADQVQVVAYNQNGFQSSNPSLNYLADIGGSVGNTVKSFSFIVTRGVPFDIAVHEVNPGAGIGDIYTLNVNNVKLAPVAQINTKMDPLPPSTNPDFVSSTGIQTGRLTRDGIQATCAAPKPNPGLFTAVGPRQYDLYTFVPATSGCVEVSIVSNPGLYPIAYNSAGFNPANPSLNYLADAGNSSTSAFPRTFSFQVVGGQPFSIVVSELNPGGAIGQDYQLQVKGVALNVTTRAAPFDLDGDCRTDVGIFRPGPGEWWYLRSIDGNNTAFQFGAGTDIIAPADFTGDGRVDVAFFRPSNGFWFVLRSEDSSFYAFPFGTSGDIPVPGDYDGDGMADAAVFRPSTATYFINNSGGGQTIRQFGLTGDDPLPLDFDGDLKTDLAVWRPSLGEWYYESSSDGQVYGFQFGQFGDKPVPSDYTGDGKADLAFVRPSNNQWFVLRSEDFSFFAFPFGITGDRPVPGDYDGDGIADAAVFRPSSNTWFVQQSTENFKAVQFGIAGDDPIPSAYLP
ncbi:MAG: VCBS repeat-containing protein [Pyrinomonadaceae bacterium]|nr:VCBS repeat-containing protein [Pyrinomonadaceae bacterium]